MSKNESLFSGRFKGLGGHGSMRETLEMVTASRMQNMVDICKKNTCFATILLFRFFRKSYFWALGVESPHGGAIMLRRRIVGNSIVDGRRLHCSSMYRCGSTEYLVSEWKLRSCSLAMLPRPTLQC